MSLSHIMFVEDNAGDFELVRLAFLHNQTSYLPIHFSNADTCLMALSDLDPSHFGVLVFDLNLLGKSGVELLKEVKNIPEWNRIPVVIWSSSINPAEKSAVLQFGAHSFVSKPLYFEELEQQILDIIQLADNFLLHEKVHVQRFQ